MALVILWRIIMTVTSTREVINESLRSHLDQLANSVSYYYGKLKALELPAELAEDLVIDWHKGKVQAWVEQQAVTARPSSDSGRQPVRR